PLPYQGSALPTELREPSPALPSGSLPNTPTGNRTPVFWLRTRCPRPLDDGGIHQPNLSKHARQDSNLQPPVLETGALPIELRASASRVRPVTASWPGAESNCRHHEFQSSPLPTDLPARSAHLSRHSASSSHQYSGWPANSPKAPRYLAVSPPTGPARALSCGRDASLPKE